MIGVKTFEIFVSLVQRFRLWLRHFISMPYLVRTVVTVFALYLAAGCSRPIPRVSEAASPATPADPVENERKSEIRITGLIQAVHSIKIVVPQIQGQFGN